VAEVCAHCNQEVHDCPGGGHRGSDVTKRKCRGWIHHNSGWHWCDPNYLHIAGRPVADIQPTLESALEVSGA
jgi:hypothetical protein